MFYDNIIDKFSNSKNVFDHKSFYLINKNLINFKTNQMSFPIVDVASMMIDSVDVEKMIANTLFDEFNQNISKIISRDIFETDRFDWVDFRGLGDITYLRDAGSRIVESIIDVSVVNGHYHKNEFSNIITTSKIVSLLQDSSYFNISAYNSNLSKRGSDINEIGSICGVKVWVDPFMDFDDNRIVMFNNVNINIDDTIISSMVSENTFTPRLKIQFKLDYRVGDSKIIYVIENESSKGWLKVKQLNRDIKINQILDEKD